MLAKNGNIATRQAVEDAFDNVMASKTFAASQQMRNLLQFVVHEELEGRGERIKAYAIAVDAMGRDAHFDPQTDASVRVAVGRLRNALETYYQTEGLGDPIRIELRKGTYRPNFIKNQSIFQPPTKTAQSSRYPRRLSACCTIAILSSSVLLLELGRVISVSFA